MRMIRSASANWMILAPGKSVECNIMHADKTSEKIMLNHSYNDLQIEWFKAGSAMNFLRKKQN